MVTFMNKIEGLLSKLSGWVLLLARVSVGIVFCNSGWYKFNHLEQTIGFFSSLGIPQAQLQVPFVAGVEFLGGLALIIGFRARLVTLPLIGVMSVAVLTAKLKEVTGVASFVGLEEFNFALILALIATNGPGYFAVSRRKRS